MRHFLFATSLILYCTNAFAQPALPDIASLRQNGINVLTWTSPYEGLRSVSVQRSSDSNLNFVTIGYVKNIKKGTQFYLDGHARPGVNWYRLKIIFGSDLSWTSNRVKIYVDSAELTNGRVLPSNDSLQLLAAKLQTKKVEIVDSSKGIVRTKTILSQGPTEITAADSAAIASGQVKVTPKPAEVLPVTLSLEIPDIDDVNVYAYIKSQYVFTNPFTGHVNIEVPEAKSAKWSLDFYDNKDAKIIEIPRLSAPQIVLDKRNFQRQGIYRFELFRDKEKVETGYITIY